MKGKIDDMEKEKWLNLTQREYVGKNGEGRLPIFNKVGIRSEVTDLVILSGGAYYTMKSINEGAVLCSDHNGAFYKVIHVGGSPYETIEDDRSVGMRPGLDFSTFEAVPKNKGYESNDNTKTEYGYLPLRLASLEIQDELSNIYLDRFNNVRNITPKGTFTTYSYNDSQELVKEHNPCYEYKRKIYMLKKADFYNDREETNLDDGKTYRSGEYVWLEFEPVKYYVDEESKKIIPEYTIISGIKPKDAEKYLEEVFPNELHQFDDYFYRMSKDNEHLKQLIKQFRDLKKSFSVNNPIRIKDKELFNCICEIINEFDNIDEIGDVAIEELRDICDTISKGLSTIPTQNELTQDFLDEHEGIYGPEIKPTLKFGNSEFDIKYEISRLIDLIESDIHRLNKYYQLGLDDEEMELVKSEPSILQKLMSLLRKNKVINSLMHTFGKIIGGSDQRKDERREDDDPNIIDTIATEIEDKKALPYNGERGAQENNFDEKYKVIPNEQGIIHELNGEEINELIDMHPDLKEKYLGGTYFFETTGKTDSCKFVIVKNKNSDEDKEDIEIFTDKFGAHRFYINGDKIEYYRNFMEMSEECSIEVTMPRNEKCGEKIINYSINGKYPKEKYYRDSEGKGTIYIDGNSLIFNNPYNKYPESIDIMLACNYSYLYEDLYKGWNGTGRDFIKQYSDILKNIFNGKKDDISVLTRDAMKNSIRGVIPPEVLEILKSYYPEITKEIEDYGKKRPGQDEKNIDSDDGRIQSNLDDTLGGQDL